MEFAFSKDLRCTNVGDKHLLGCILWNHVSHEHNSSSISAVLVYGEYSSCKLNFLTSSCKLLAFSPQPLSLERNCYVVA